MNTQIQQDDYFSKIDIDQDQQQLQQPSQQPEIKQKRQSRKGKQNSKIVNSNQIAKDEVNQINMQTYEMNDEAINFYHQYDVDKVQYENVQNEIVFTPQGDIRMDYQEQFQQYAQQGIIEPAKQYNSNFSQQIYMNHPTAANTPYIDNNQIGLINSYDTQRNPIYLDNPSNQYFTYQQNQVELAGNVVVQENIYPNNQIIEPYATPAPPQLLTGASAKQKKPRNQSSKSVENTQENTKGTSNTKKGKKGNSDKNQQESIQEITEYTDIYKLQEQEQVVNLDKLGNMNIISKQEFQIANQYDRSQEKLLDNNNNSTSIPIPIPQIQKRKSQQVQQPKEQKSIKSINIQTSGLTIKLNRVEIPQETQQNEQNQYQNEQFNDQNKFQIQNIMLGDGNSNNNNKLDIINNQQILNIPQNIHQIHQNQQQQQQQNLLYINSQQNENNICNQEMQQQLDQQNQKYLVQQQPQFLQYNQNQQFIQGHGIANQAYTFVSNEALGFGKQDIDEENQQQQQQIYEYNNQDQIENQENIADQNYQTDTLPAQPSLQNTGKKRYSKKNAKTGENAGEAPPKKQREKKQSTSDKSNTTINSSSTTTGSMLNQNQVEQQIKYDNDKLAINENLNQQNHQIEQEQIKVENGSNLLQEEQIQPNIETELLKQTSKQQKEPRKRAPSKKKVKANNKVIEEQEDKQEEFVNQEQNADPVIHQQLEIEQQQQEMQINHHKNMFNEMNLIQNLQKKLNNEHEIWNNNKNVYIYQQPPNNINQIYQHDNLGLQQLEQTQIQNQVDDQINIDSLQKFHNEQINQHHLQHQGNPSLKLTQREYSKIQGKQNIIKEVMDQDDDQMKQTQYGIELLSDQVNKFSQINLKQVENGGDDDDLSNKQQSFAMMPEKLSKKKSSKEKEKDTNRKRKAANSIIPQTTSNNSNSEIDNQHFDDNMQIPNTPAPITKEKSVNEKKRGIRDLTTEEKWDVFQQYDKLKSYRGVGRLFNMDHSTVKLLVNRIQNERPNETITKEIFLSSQIAQQSSENSVSKKLKKEKSLQETQLNATSNSQQKLQRSQSKSEKNKERRLSLENIIEEQENNKQEDQIHLFDQKTKESHINFQSQENNLSNNVQDSQIKVEEKIENAQDEQHQLPEPAITKSKSKKESSRKQANSKRRNSSVVKPQTETLNNLNEQIIQQGQINSNQQDYQYDQQRNVIHNIHNDQMQLEQVQQNMLSNKISQDIKFEQEQYEGGNAHNYEIYQNMNQGENLINYQDQHQDKNYHQIHQQQYQTAHLQQNIYQDVNDENKNGNHLNIQIQSQQDYDQGQNQLPASLNELHLKSKSSIKMTAEEKKAKKELKKQIQEQQKAQAKLDKPPKVKKGKGKGQQEQQVVNMQEYRQDDQNYQPIAYDQNIQFNNGYENQYIYQNFDPNMAYMQQTYQLNEYQNYPTKYEDDYDINIYNLEINNQNNQHQQMNPQSYDNDEIKLELN